MSIEAGIYRTPHQPRVWHYLIPGKRESVRRNRRMEEGGCGIRTLESMLGVRATDAEIDARLDQFDRELAAIRDLQYEYYSFRTVYGEPAGIEEFLSAKQRLAKIKTTPRDLINSVSINDTPLGRALRAVDIEEALLTVEEIGMLVDTPDKKVAVLINTARRTHLAHIVRASDGSLVKQSDRGEKFLIENPDSKYAAIVIAMPTC